MDEQRKASRVRARARASRTARRAAEMALSKLSGDEQGIILGQLCNTLEPRLAMYFSGASSELRVLLPPAVRQQLRADHEVATALCRKLGMESCKELREATSVTWGQISLSAANLSVTIENSLPGVAMLAGVTPRRSESTMSLWDMLPFDIESMIAMLFVARIIGVNGTGIEGDTRIGIAGPNSVEREQNLQRLYALRRMRKSFCIALRPIHLLYKSIQSADHANAFVKGILLILEQMTEPKEMCSSFGSCMYFTVYGGCTQKRIHLEDPGNQSASYYNALNENIAAMLQNEQLSSSKFQPGWRVGIIMKIFRYLDRFHVKRCDVPNVTDMVNQTVSEV